MQGLSGDESSQVVDLSIDFAKQYISDQSFCDLLQYQDQIAKDDPIEASEVQSKINSFLYKFLDERQASHLLLQKTRVALSLIRPKMKGEIEEIDSPETIEFIKEQFINYPHFYGTS